MRRLVLAAILLLPTIAQAAIYDVQCTAQCVASDNTTQPSGTILNLIQWCGNQTQCPYTPTDAAGNSQNVALVADPQGTGIVYQPVGQPQPVPAQSEYDCVITTGSTCALPPGTGLSQWTGSGTSVIFVLPSNPIVGPQSLLQVNDLATQAIAVTVQYPPGTTIKTTTVTGPKVVRLEYTNTGWAILPN
jgi:hypothetical protein